MPIRIYTRTGDSGETGLLGGARAPKNSPRVECLGAVDELSSQIGLARCALGDQAERGFLVEVQRRLFVLGAELAQPKGTDAGDLRISEGDVEALERFIDDCIAQLEDVASFIVPGSAEEAARLHVARAVCRRAERRIVSLSETEPVRPEAIRYVNRLSDALYGLARRHEKDPIFVDGGGAGAGAD